MVIYHFFIRKGKEKEDKSSAQVVEARPPSPLSIPAHIPTSSQLPPPSSSPTEREEKETTVIQVQNNIFILLFDIC